MSQAQTQLATEADFVLEPVQPVALPSLEQAKRSIAALAPEVKQEVDAKVAARVEDFVARINSADLQSDEFRGLLQKVFDAGRKEIADTTNFIKSNPTLNQVTLGDLDDSPANKAMQEMTDILAKANPKGQDLLGPVTVMGVPVPFLGNKLRAYSDKFKPLGARLDELTQVLDADEDEQQREIIGYDDIEKALYAKLEQMDRATQYLGLLDTQLEGQAGAIAATDPQKAKVLTEEVLFYVRGNFGDACSVKLLTILALGQIRQLRHTGRMTMRATNRIKTLGMAALQMAQTIAVVVYKQKKRMETNRKSQDVVNAVIAGVGDDILQHTKDVIAFESSPVLALQALETSFAKVNEAVNLYSNFKSAAVLTMKADNTKMLTMAAQNMNSLRIGDASHTPAPASRDLDIMSI